MGVTQSTTISNEHVIASPCFTDTLLIFEAQASPLRLPQKPTDNPSQHARLVIRGGLCKYGKAACGNLNEGTAMLSTHLKLGPVPAPTLEALPLWFGRREAQKITEVNAIAMTAPGQRTERPLPAFCHPAHLAG